MIVSGYLQVDAESRDSYLESCRAVVAAAPVVEGRRDFAVSEDLLDPRRINILEVWEGRGPLDAFRGTGTGDDQSSMIRSASVAEYDVTGERSL